MNNYRKYNIWCGWIAFAISAVVYLVTMEPTASLWDCAEFIATSYKLEIGHPPGAPLFMMISRFFTLFAPDVSKVAVMVNAMSSLASAFTILFLFWTITHFARKFFGKSKEQLSKGEIWAVMGAGLIGSLAYTFTDTFWFSAIEGEVYALSSLFTAVVFWAILKWEDVADQPQSNRWLVLIAYLMGLSIGVHLLNLLAFPAMVFIYYFKKYPVNTKGILAATGISVAIIIFVLYMVVPGTVLIGASVDRFFVNVIGTPVNSGLLTFVMALFAACAYLIYLTHKKGKVILNTFFLMFTVVLLGYSSYASVVIRSSVNPPMNSNSPDNPYGLISLLNRDQYGQQPLFFGPYYSSPAIDYKFKTTYHVGDDGKYKADLTTVGVKYDPNFVFFFPRMHSNKDYHIEAYQEWGQVRGKQIPFGSQSITVPTFSENLRYFFAYQVNFMYWRYFLWNFVGRQSDTPSTGEITDGNWMSGIKFIDEIYLGPQDNIPSELANNRGRNKYYFLPFILGMIGLFYQLLKDKRGFVVIMWLFFMTGLAIILYLNQSPSEPRERDYAYAGSFYAFAIWIGFGVIFLYEVLKKWLKKAPAAAIVATVVCTSVPLILAAQNWNDHDRSHRYVARDFGANYLNALLPNSIIMNYGDNDTFPLWYSQEVEGTRPDVRIMNMSYLDADWYIDQMRVKANKSDPVPFSLPRDKYFGVNESLRVYELFDRYVDIKQIIDWVKSDDPRTKEELFGNKLYSWIPSKKISLPVNKENVLKTGLVKAEDADLIVDAVYLNISKSSISRGDMMFLDMLANFNWERPLFTTQLSILQTFGLLEYIQWDGFVYRFVPIKTSYDSYFTLGRIDTDYMYENLMERFSYGNIKDPRVYVDHTIKHLFSSTRVMSSFARLASELAKKGEINKALKVLQYAEQEMPATQLPYTYSATVPLIEAYYATGNYDRGNEILMDYARVLKEYIEHYLDFPERKKNLVFKYLSDKASILYELSNVAGDNGQDEQYSQITGYLMNIIGS
ncbi:MAG: DUF2723 domain-containing protein [Rikenellaceae bacterium]|nr:DUF2723 domain-containing protein [Rikenellaceae bacterium]